MDTESNKAQGRSKGAARGAGGQKDSRQEVRKGGESSGEIGSEGSPSKDSKGVRLMDDLETKFLTHEAVCAERWTETILRIKRIEAILIGSAGAIIMLLLGIALRGH
jgi:hypothetical protein